MMNKFLIFPCVKQNNDNGYNGTVVTLACESDMSFVLFFPMSEENSQLINYILETNPNQYTSSQNIIGIYKTMLDSWEAGGRYLAGISLDTEFDSNTQEDTISVKLVISDEDGAVDSIIKVNFIHAILLAAMERKEVLVSNDLLSKLIPQNEIEGEECEEIEENDNMEGIEGIEGIDSIKEVPKKEQKFPVDKDILDIAKKIMSGKIK